MDETQELLHSFGFTARDAKKIAQRAHNNDLTLADVQAWIDEAQSSTSLNNPLGFVRARLQDGDRLPERSAADCHHLQRHRYKAQFAHLYPNTPHNEPDVTQACQCGRVVWKDLICQHCGRCPYCCVCDAADPHKE